MGAWGITMRQSDYGLDLLRTIVEAQLKKADFAAFNVTEAIELLRKDIVEEIKRTNRSCPPEKLDFYISENFPRDFAQAALLIGECLADYYRTSFHIRGVNLGYENDVVTGADGRVVLESMPSGCYEITETAVPSPWILDANNRKTVWIDAEKDKDVTADFVNSTRPGIRLLKLDGQTGKPVAGATFLIEEVNGGFSDRRQTDKDGLIVLEGKDGVRPGAYKITEVAAAPNYVLDDTVHVVQLEENRTTTIELTNLVKPTLKILKVDSITKDPVAHAKFQIWRASGDTKTGDYHDLGTFYSNEAGEIVLEHTDPGWFKISELEAPSGYSIKQADYEFYLAAGETKTVQVENVPLSALVVYKYDRISGEPVEGAIFQVKYLSGASGTGGTVIGTYRTLKNGSFTVTGLQAGAYIVEELASDSGHIVDAAPQTAYISGKQQDVVQLYFGNSPKSSLLMGVSALDGAVSALGVKKALEAVQDGISGLAADTRKSIERAENMGHDLRSAGGHLKNVGRALLGKETQVVNGGQEGRFQSVVLAPMRATQRLLSGMNNATLAAIGSTEHLEQRAAEVRAAKAERTAERPGKRLTKKPSVRQDLEAKKLEAVARAAAAPDREHKPPEAAL